MLVRVRFRSSRRLASLSSFRGGAIADPQGQEPAMEQRRKDKTPKHGPLGWDVTDPVFELYNVRADDRLGSGADGVVLRGALKTPSDPGRWHALKVVSTRAYAVDAELKALELMARAPHQNVVELVRAFPPHGRRPQHVLVFDEADMDLRAFLRKPGGRCTRPLADALGKQLLLAISHMHDHMLLHRDLRPHNIFAQ